MLSVCRLDRVRGQTFDIAVFGGGLDAVAAARDAASRGFSVLLLAPGDYAAGSPPCFAVGSGIAAVERGMWRWARTLARERDRLLRNAPQVARLAEFVAPVYKWSLYRQTVAKLSLEAASSTIEPTFANQGLEGAFLWHDAVVRFTARLVMDTLHDAIGHGACALNYADVEESGMVRDLIVGGEASFRARTVMDLRDEPGVSGCALSPLATRPVALLARDGRRIATVLTVDGIAFADVAADRLSALAGALPEAPFATLYWTTVSGASRLGLYRVRAEKAVNRAARSIGSRARSTTFTAPIPEVAPSVSEQCWYLEDYMLRRAPLALGEDQGLAEAPRAAVALGAVHGWTQGRIEAELVHYRQKVIASRQPVRGLRATARGVR